MCCSMTQLSVNFIRTTVSAIGRSLRGHGCGNCCPDSGFFGPQSSEAIVAAVQSFAVWYGTTACVQVPIHSRNTASLMAAMSTFQPTAGAWLCCQHNTTGHAFHLVAAHCILIRAISRSSVLTATSERTSAAVCMFGGARVFVCSICKAARMLWESIWSEARIVSAFSVVLCCKVWGAISARNLTCQHITHIHTQELNPRACLS